ncbi:hypothetical protein J4218_02720 [Candidatus Pacearchaeota archaeon]|nr:hypothetical protein [Candidatus Pacearchaeota archaeon]
MQVLERDKKEIEIRASKMSDFLKMEYFESCLKKFTDHEIQKFCCMELSKLYENKFMYPEAIKYIFKFQEITGNPMEKKKAMQKEIELLIKGGFYEKAEGVIKKTFGMLTEGERFELRRNVVTLYKSIGEKAEKNGRNAEVVKVYERLLPYTFDNERNHVKVKLIESYKKLGKIREAIELEKEIERVAPARVEPERRRFFGF